MSISRRHFGLRGAAATKAVSPPARVPKLPAKRWSAKQIKSGLSIVAVILLVSIKLWYFYEQRQVFKNAPEHVLRTCAGANVLSPDRDAYYHCILRVEAGGQT